MVTPVTGGGDALLSELAGSGHASYTSTRRVFRIIDRVSTGGERLTVKALARDLARYIDGVLDTTDRAAVLPGGAGVFHVVSDRVRG